MLNPDEEQWVRRRMRQDSFGNTIVGVACLIIMLCVIAYIFCTKTRIINADT